MSCWMYPWTDAAHKMSVVLPLCPKDGELLLANLNWQHELDGKKDFACVLAVEAGTHVALLAACETAANRTYTSVQRFTYPRAPKLKWPNAPNWAFQHSARFMQRGLAPWFWMEPDCIPLKSSWLDFWNHEYFARRRAIMGFIIPGMGHCNGTAVYPANFPALCPPAMNCTEMAWDDFLKGHLSPMIADASDLMCHVWGVTDGKARIIGGEPAVFRTQQNVTDWVDPNAILFHRAKDTTLIQRLRERRYENLHPDRNLSQRPALLGA